MSDKGRARVSVNCISPFTERRKRKKGKRKGNLKSNEGKTSELYQHVPFLYIDVGGGQPEAKPTT